MDKCEAGNNFTAKSSEASECFWGALMRIVGIIFILIGGLMSMTIIGASIGIPMMFIGLLMVLFGGRRKTVINNVIQVSNNGGAPHYSSSDSDRAHKEPSLRAWTGRPVSALPLAPRLPRVQPPPADDDFELSYENEEFVDARSELSQAAKKILAQAQKDGFAVTARPTSVTIRSGDQSQILTSNEAIYSFGRNQRYDFDGQ